VLAGQHQDINRAIVDGSSMATEDRSQCRSSVMQPNIDLSMMVEHDEDNDANDEDDC